MKVYLIRIEVKGQEGSSMPKSVKSAFVNCVVPGSDRDSAVQKLKEALVEDKYFLVKIDKIEDFENLEFVSKDKNYLQMAKDAVSQNSVFYGDFNVW